MRARLVGLQLNPRLAPFARAEIEIADQAVLRAEQADPDDPDSIDLVAAARQSVDHAVSIARRRYGAAIGD